MFTELLYPKWVTKVVDTFRTLTATSLLYVSGHDSLKPFSPSASSLWVLVWSVQFQRLKNQQHLK